jgi:hypothetical protein
LVLNAAQSEDQELRDTATRALGKFTEAIPSSDLPEDQRQAIIDTLKTNLADTNAGIRAKAVRSLGKMAKKGHLDEAEQEQLREVCELVLGIDGSFDWDRAYIVRKEAKEALEHL